MLLLVDTNNLYYTAKHLGLKVDYRELIVVIEKVTHKKVDRKIAYLPDIPNGDPEFIACLQRDGWEVVSKPGKKIGDITVTNYNVEIVVDAIDSQEEEIVIASNEKDLLPGVDLIVSYGVKLHMYAYTLPKCFQEKVHWIHARDKRNST